MKDFRLPDPGEGLVEAEIVTWRVAVGDEVKVNDIVVEVETSKSLVELPIPYAGTVAALLVNEGDLVDVGTPIISIDDGVSAPDPAGTPLADEAPSVQAGAEEIEAGKLGGEAPGGRVAVLVGYGPKTGEAKRRPRKMPANQQLDQHTHTQQTHTQVADTFTTSAPVSFRSDERKPLSPREASPVGAPLPGPGAAPAAPVPSRGAILAKPPVRKLAKDLAVNLDSIAGTGAGGVITRGDVEAAAAAPHEAVTTREDVPVTAATAKPVVGADTRIAVKGVRKLTAEAMVASAFTAPHVTEWLTCDVSAAMELLERLKARREFTGVRISPLLLVAKAVCLALRRTPGINACWDADSAEIVIKGTVNLGIAAATPRGLLVPNIKNAAQLSLLDLAVAINDLVGVAKEGRTQPSDTAHGTFTITNVGVFGVDAGTPILNPGEAGILCLGAIARRPWVVGVGDEERIEPRWVTTLAVSFDHRVVDGEQGSTFLSDVAGILSDPGISLLF